MGSLKIYFNKINKLGRYIRSSFYSYLVKRKINTRRTAFCFIFCLLFRLSSYSNDSPLALFKNHNLNKQKNSVQIFIIFHNILLITLYMYISYLLYETNTISGFFHPKTLRCCRYLIK